jgi:DNA mismatch repair protein MutS
LAAKVNNQKETPLMKQYNQIKVKYPGALLLFRVGDFYETFGEDAVKASKILGIVLTKRSNGKASEVELAGFPHHSLDTYLPKLVRAGQRVAICDQLEDPKKTKDLVKRGVTELVTPGVTLNDKVLESKQSNYLAALFHKDGQYGLALLDISTGEFMAAQGGVDYTTKLLQGLKPSELIFTKQHRDHIQEKFGNQFYTFTLDDWIFTHEFAYDRLIKHFKVKNLKGYGLQDQELAIIAAGACLYYLEQTHHKHVEHIRQISRIDENQYVWLDHFTIRNLELLQSSHPNGTCLLDVIDHTLTPMGSRLLRKWTVLPLSQLNAIQNRLNVVEHIYKNTAFAKELSESLKQVGDLERLVSKISVQRISPREILQVARALNCVTQIKEKTADSKLKELLSLSDQLNPCKVLLDRIALEINPEAPAQLGKGAIFTKGVHEELDDLREITTKGKDYLLSIQKREAENTGITSLKIAFNNVFGYFLEVTNSHKDKVPPEWIRKQTLVNAERYITPELKVYEDKILNAEDKIQEIEYQLFANFLNDMAEYITPLQHNASVTAQIDCMYSFATVAKLNNYVKPLVNEGYTVALTGCRHPVIETQLPADSPYVPNDILLDNDKQQVIILTGPNMSGKSALLRQTALSVLLAQMGCFVPCSHAEIGLVDKIYTRVGASDNISQGESTFMVEMTETASILNNLSNRSLVILDEIGRGTSTYDGVSLAWAIAEYLHQHKTKPKTLFATHYHELNELEEQNQGVVNYHVSTKEVGDKVLFLRKIKKGGSAHSFGIHVAQMAGVPIAVVKRSAEILSHLESERGGSLTTKPNFKKVPPSNYQLNLFEINDPVFKKIKEQLEQLETNSLTPIEALIKIKELQDLLK